MLTRQSIDIISYTIIFSELETSKQCAQKEMPTSTNCSNHVNIIKLNVIHNY